MYEVAIVIFLLICVAMIALILVQQGKGAGMGASFGQGASQTVFGSAGSGNFLTRSTWFLIIAFFAICLAIGWMQKNAHSENTSDFSNLGGAETSAPASTTAPATDAPASDAPATDVPPAE